MVIKKTVNKKFKRITITGVGSLGALLILLVGLSYYGISVESSGDINCGDTCISYFNITLKNYSVCFGKTFNAVLTEPKVKTEVYLLKEGYWSNYNFKGCLDKNTKYQFKLIGHKNPNDKVKWGLDLQGKNIDPYWNPIVPADSYNLTSSENLTFTGNQNITRYLKIYRYANITNATINFWGYNTTSFPLNVSFLINNSLFVNNNYNESIITPSIIYGTQSFQNIGRGWKITMNQDYSLKSVGVDSYVTADQIVISRRGEVNSTLGIYPIINKNATINLSLIAGISYYIIANNSNGSNFNWIANVSISLPIVTSLFNISKGIDTSSTEQASEIYNLNSLTFVNILNSTNSIITVSNATWSYLGEFNGSNVKTKDFGFDLNSVLNNSICTGGTLIGDYCNIPFIFHSNTAGILKYSNVSIEYTLNNVSIGLSQGIGGVYFYPNASIVNSTQPKNQTNTKGLFTINNTNNFNVSIWARLDNVRNGINLKLNYLYDYASSIILNTSNQKISNCMSNNSVGYLWSWADYFVNTNTCYQEFANRTTCTGQNQSVYPNGSYAYTNNWMSAINLTDGDWSSLSVPINESFFYIKYQKPNYAINASWIVGLKNDSGSLNISINIMPSCIRNPTYLKIAPYFCYQETANISTSCGGLDTGSYSSSSLWMDGNWTTKVIDNFGDLRVNYSKPANIPFAIWEVGNYYCNSFSECSYSYGNISLPLNCVNQNPIQFKINSTSQRCHFYNCYNGTTWENIGTGGNCGTIGTNYFVEEGIYWSSNSFYCRNNTNWQYLNNSAATGIYEEALNWTMNNNETYQDWYPNITITSGEC